MAFLDDTGVTRLLNDIKSKFTAPKSIAYVESTTAKTNHAAGDYFMIGEQLKRATSAIATGETIGTSNSADDTVQGQIDTLRDSVGTALNGSGIHVAGNTCALYWKDGGTRFRVWFRGDGIQFSKNADGSWTDLWTWTQ